MRTRPAGDHFTTIPWKNSELSLSFPPVLSPSRARESTIATDLYALARGVKLTTRVGKPATLRANQCVNAGRMIYPSLLPMQRVSRRHPDALPPLNLDLNLHLRYAISAPFYASWWDRTNKMEFLPLFRRGGETRLRNTGARTECARPRF